MFNDGLGHYYYRAYRSANADLIANNQGGALTSAAMVEYLGFYVLALAVFLCLSTMISSSYYGERCRFIYLGMDHP